MENLKNLKIITAIVVGVCAITVLCVLFWPRAEAPLPPEEDNLTTEAWQDKNAAENITSAGGEVVQGSGQGWEIRISQSNKTLITALEPIAKQYNVNLDDYMGKSIDVVSFDGKTGEDITKHLFIYQEKNLLYSQTLTTAEFESLKAFLDEVASATWTE